VLAVADGHAAVLGAGALDAGAVVLACWSMPDDLVADAEVLTSELMTNATQAAASVDPDEPIALRLLANQQRLVIEAWDCHPGDPLPRPASDDAESGRGLGIVHELANRWGTRRLSPNVKAVRAELLLPARHSWERGRTMSDTVDRVRELGERGVRLLPARELLVVIGDLFVELMPVEPSAATDEDIELAALMRQALAEVTDRVGKLCPVVSSTACSCGQRFVAAEELDEHFGEVFIPADDIGLDGQAHAEVFVDED
jgi:anti-sigma regulatory factor (Ser/Thr protein kinase)